MIRVPSNRRSASGPSSVVACYDRTVDDADVGDFLRFLGFAVLKLVTLGRYRSGSNGLFLEGCLGLLLVAAMFFILSRLVL